MGAIGVELGNDGCLTLTIDSPATRNALTLKMIADIRDGLMRAAEDPQCRMVLIRGTGEDFCIGRDIPDVGDTRTQTDDELRRNLQPIKQIVQLLHEFPKPTLCVVTGYALGLGTALVALSDIAIASVDSSFGFPEARLGMPMSLTSVALLANVPPKGALPLLFTGMIINGGQAEAIHLITRAYEREALEAGVGDWVAQLLQASSSGIALTKRLMRQGAETDFATKLDLAVETAVCGFRTPDAIAGRGRFLKRSRQS